MGSLSIRWTGIWFLRIRPDWSRLNTEYFGSDVLNGLRLPMPVIACPWIARGPGGGWVRGIISTTGWV